MVTALQIGLTNVATFMVGPERWDTPYMFDGLFDKPRSHHQMSHKQKQFVEHLKKVDRFHMEQFAYMVAKMGGITEPDGTTLLDNTLLTYGSGLGDGSTHQYNDLPLVVAGGTAGKYKLGKHIHCKPGTPLANLWLTHMHVLGIKRERYADSTGMLSEILA